MPVSAVEDPNLARYVKSLNPDATVPGRKKLQKMINNISDKFVSQIREALLTARRVAATTDIWSSQLSSDSFIGVTVHFINGKTGKRMWLKISKCVLRGF